jgi:hypothetical protein
MVMGVAHENAGRENQYESALKVPEALGGHAVNIG